jgi:hypothetical protein
MMLLVDFFQVVSKMVLSHAPAHNDVLTVALPSLHPILSTMALPSLHSMLSTMAVSWLHPMLSTMMQQYLTATNESTVYCSADYWRSD